MLFLESSEGGEYFLNLVWHEDGLDWLKVYLVNVLLRYTPLVLKRNPRLVLDVEFLVL